MHLKKMKKKKLKAFVIESGKTLNSGQQFVEQLSYRAKKVEEADECDVILAFCPIVSRVGTDIEAALKIFQDCSPIPKPIILVVLHHTFDKEYVIPDCNRYARDHVSCIVNGLFHEDEGLLKNCKVNTQALECTLVKLKEIQKDQRKNSKESDDSEDDDSEQNEQTEREAGGKGVPQNKLGKKAKMASEQLKVFVIESGKTLHSGQQFVEGLSSRARVVQNVDECDVILAFCPIVSRLGTDIEAALKVFKDCSPTPKPIILVVLHHTFDREYVIPDCNRYARDHVSYIVNGLFHEDEGLLKNCKVNTHALECTLVKLKELKKEKKQKQSSYGKGELLAAQKEKKQKEVGHEEDKPPLKRNLEDEQKAERSSSPFKKNKACPEGNQEGDRKKDQMPSPVQTISPKKNLEDEQKAGRSSSPSKRNQVGPEVIQEGDRSKEQMPSGVQTTSPKKSHERQYQQPQTNQNTESKRGPKRQKQGKCCCSIS